MDHGIVTDIATCIIAAWVVGVVCRVVRQPLLIAYLVAGFAIGPHGFRFITDPDSIRTMAEIGLALLLFMIGLEMDLKKMLGSGRAALEGEAATLADLRPIDITDLSRIGPDIRIIGTPGAAQREHMDDRKDVS